MNEEDYKRQQTRHMESESDLRLRIVQLERMHTDDTALLKRMTEDYEKQQNRFKEHLEKVVNPAYFEEIKEKEALKKKVKEQEEELELSEKTVRELKKQIAATEQKEKKLNTTEDAILKLTQQVTELQQKLHEANEEVISMRTMVSQCTNQQLALEEAEEKIEAMKNSETQGEEIVFDQSEHTIYIQQCVISDLERRLSMATSEQKMHRDELAVLEMRYQTEIKTIQSKVNYPAFMCLQFAHVAMLRGFFNQLSRQAASQLDACQSTYPKVYKKWTQVVNPETGYSNMIVAMQKSAGQNTADETRDETIDAVLLDIMALKLMIIMILNRLYSGYMDAVSRICGVGNRPKRRDYHELIEVACCRAAGRIREELKEILSDTGKLLNIEVSETVFDSLREFL
jgi:hypothetical protein